VFLFVPMQLTPTSRRARDNMMQANTMLGNPARALEAQPTGAAGMKPSLSAAVNAADARHASLDQRQQAPDFIG
jgi:hypothetical protein